MRTEFREVRLPSPDYSLTLELRRRVLLEPFGIQLDAARMDDGTSAHLALFDTEEDACLACLLLVPRDRGALQMRQVAVAPSHRRVGLGRQLVNLAEDWAREHGSTFVYANARDAALPFYRALGYAEVSEPFLEVGLLHRRVEKELERDERSNAR